MSINQLRHEKAVIVIYHTSGYFCDLFNKNDWSEPNIDSSLLSVVEEQTKEAYALCFNCAGGVI